MKHKIVFFLIVLGFGCFASSCMTMEDKDIDELGEMWLHEFRKTVTGATDTP